MSATQTDLAKAAAEKEAAKKLLEQLGSLNETVPKMLDRLKALEAADERFKDVDPKKVMGEIEKLQAGFDTIRRAIATKRSALYIPGLEDEAKKFSLLRCVLAVKQGGSQAAFEKLKAGFEFEVIKTFREKASADGQVVGVDSQGGFFVPDQVIPDVIQALYTRSVLLALTAEGTTRVSVIDGLVGTPAKIPKFEGGMIAYWIGEQDDFAESKSKVGNVTMTPKKLGVLFRITNEMRRFGAFGFENLLRNDMVRAAAKEVDRVILYGTGTANMPRGITKMDGVHIFSAETGQLETSAPGGDAQGGELSYDQLDEMMGVLEDNNVSIDDSFAYISCPRYFRRLKSTRVQNYTGQNIDAPYLLGGPLNGMPGENRLKEIIGDFDKTTQIGTTNKPGASVGWASATGTANFTDVFGANWADVVVGRWSGIEIEDDDGKGQRFVSDETQVKMRLLMDVGHRQEKAIVVCPDAKVRGARAGVYSY